MTAAIVVKPTKTAGWRVVYRGESSHEFVIARRLATRDAAAALAASAQTVYGVPVEDETA